MQKSALDLYRHLVAVIDKAAVDENIYDVPKAAEAAGMPGGPISGIASDNWDFTFTDEAGASVQVNCYWRDTSRAFSIGPDHHVMRVDYKATSETLSHVRTYDTM